MLLCTAGSGRAMKAPHVPAPPKPPAAAAAAVAAALDTRQPRAPAGPRLLPLLEQRQLGGRGRKQAAHRHAAGAGLQASVRGRGGGARHRR